MLLRYKTFETGNQMAPVLDGVMVVKVKFTFRINLLFYLIFPPSSHPTFVFLSCRPFVVKTTFSAGLVGVEVSSTSWLGQLTVGV